MSAVRPHVNLATTWEAVADAISDQAALIHGQRRLTWREFDQCASRVAAAFSASGLGEAVTRQVPREDPRARRAMTENGFMLSRI